VLFSWFPRFRGLRKIMLKFFNCGNFAFSTEYRATLNHPPHEPVRLARLLLSSENIGSFG